MRKPIARLIALLAVCAVCAGAFSACDPSGMRRDELYRITYAEDGSPIVTFNPDYKFDRSAETDKAPPGSLAFTPYFPTFDKMWESHLQNDSPGSFYLIEIVRRLSEEETEERYGHIDEYNRPGGVTWRSVNYYDVVLIYDYLRGEAVNQHIIYAHYFSRFYPGDPPMVAGEKITALINGPVFDEVYTGGEYSFFCYDDVVTSESCVYLGRSKQFLVEEDMHVTVPEELKIYSAPSKLNPRYHFWAVKLGAAVERLQRTIEEGGYDFPKD